MYLKPDTQRALEAWALTRTWDSAHTLDLQRWYRFIDQYERDHGRSVDERMLREHVELIVGGNLEDKQRLVLQERIRVMYEILQFLEVTGR